MTNKFTLKSPALSPSALGSRKPQQVLFLLHAHSYSPHCCWHLGRRSVCRPTCHWWPNCSLSCPAVLVVQHFTPEPNGQQLLDRLARPTELRCRLLIDGKTTETGTLYLAPPDRHRLAKDGSVGHLLVTKAPREDHCRCPVPVGGRGRRAAHSGRGIHKHAARWYRRSRVYEAVGRGGQGIGTRTIPSTPACPQCPAQR